MLKALCAGLVALLCWAAQAQAHFGMVIPSTPTVVDKKEAALRLDIAFAHPMELHGMNMAAPRAVTVTHDGATEDLKPALASGTLMGHKAWQAAYTVKKPGVYQFAVEPEPYFEPAEDAYIIHYTKTVVAAFGEEEGWDTPLGLKTEIVPLTRPFANYAGNVFRGRVLVDGKPSPGTTVEVECYNRDKKHAAPNDYYVTQVVKTDADGVFTVAAPWAGWWGFAALTTASEKMEYKGEPKPVELGAVLWVNFAAPKAK
jgi:cobalt/nickel transport protein